MTIEANITNALEDLRSDPSALEEIAAEYGIKADVLRARAEKAYGSVEALANRGEANARLAQRAAEAAAEKLADGIKRLEAMFQVMRDHPAKGTEFNYQGETYVFVLLSASHPKYYARCVHKGTGTIVGFNKPAFTKIITPAIERARLAKAA